jgi:hypothetical protein
MPNKVKTGSVYESQDSRDTDPKQPGGLRRVRVIASNESVATIENMTTGRKTVVMVTALASSKWKKVK